jgi:hypothetical protein
MVEAAHHHSVNIAGRTLIVRHIPFKDAELYHSQSTHVFGVNSISLREERGLEGERRRGREGEREGWREGEKERARGKNKGGDLQ